MATGRFYTIHLPSTAITAAADLFEITVASEKPIRIWALKLGQTSDQGDASEETLRVTIQTGVTAGTGGSAQTPQAGKVNQVTVGASSTNRTTAHTGGTVEWTEPWNVRIPLEVWWTEETAIEATSATDPVTITLDAPADSLSVFGMVLIEEMV